MKCYFSIALIALSLAVAIPASAQEEKKASLPLTKPTPIADIIEAMTKEEGLKVTGLNQLTEDMTFKGDLELRPVASVVSKLVKPFGFETVLDDTTIHIRRSTPAAAQAIPAPTAQTAATSQAGFAQPAAPQTRFSYSAGVLPDNYQGGPTWMDHAMQRQHEWEAMNAATLAYRYSAPANIYMEPNVGYPGFGGGFGSGYGGYVMPWMKGCVNGPSGYIKFKYDGRSAERKLWYIYLNGFVAGSMDQGDSFWNKIHVCAENTMVKIQKLGAKDTIEFPYSVRPGDLTEIGVGDYLFDPGSVTKK